ncbi:hypothetical protein [Solihabitans fulvus]|uniref:hypothetical protein n=1 Tax=Solihabitans fulvus TaxID=1892852 RepID=UPI001661F321|nr:hypothetical protein [Solihabitans fulvus]
MSAPDPDDDFDDDDPVDDPDAEYCDEEHFGDEENFEDEDFDDEEEDDGNGFEVTREPRTVCHLCGGAGFIADPKLAVIAGMPRTIDNGRECPHCNGAQSFSGMVPPM